MTKTPEEREARIIRERMQRRKPIEPQKQRACLRCQSVFISTGNHHRMCDKCRVACQDTSPFESDVECSLLHSHTPRIAEEGDHVGNH